jgi:hypothetical protein
VGVGNNGIGHALLGPVEASTTTNDGGHVHLRCDTQYPFTNELVYSINASDPFDFYVRVPGWYVPSKSSITINNDGASLPLSADPSTGMHKVSIPKGHTTVLYSLGARAQIEKRPRDTVAIRHGALLFSLDIAQRVKTLPARHYGNAGDIPHRFKTNHTHDFQISSTSPWAVAIDPSTLEFHSNHTTSLPSPVWTRGAPPSWFTVLACEIHWPYAHGVIADPPVGERRKCKGRTFEAKLIPFGAAKLHMSELPVLDLKGGNHDGDLDI